MKKAQHMKFYEKLKKINQGYVLVFTDYNNRSDVVNRKTAAAIVSEAYGLLQEGSIEQRNQTKQFFLAIFRQFIKQFIEFYVLEGIGRYSQQENMKRLIEKWENFKKFTFFYYTIFQYAHNHYQSAYKSYENQGKVNKLQNNGSIFPIAAVALNQFHISVYTKFRGVIHRQIRRNLAQQRMQPNKTSFIDKQEIKSLLQIVYCSGLRQMGRIGSIRGINNQVQFQFYRQKNNDLSKHFESEEKNHETFMSQQILNSIITDSEQYYKDYYSQKLSILSPIDDFTKVAQLVSIEEEKSDFYLFSNYQKTKYLKKIKDNLIVKDLQERLTRENGLRYYLQQYNFQSKAYLEQFRLFVKTIFRSKQQTLPIFQKIFQGYILQSGNKINQKINKRKQYILEMIVLKKSINCIIEQAMERDLKMCIVRDKCFRKILDSIEASRNLAQFADLKIKQCIKMKLSQDDCLQKLKDVFLILQNIAATDSFLLYHQQMLAKRLVDSLNQPKLEIQIIFLRKLGEKLGLVTISSHLNMIKDIQSSQELTDQFNKKLAFCNFRWSCRIINQAFWPDIINKSKLEIKLPMSIRLHAQTVSSLFHEAYEYRYLQWKTQKGYSLFEGNFKSGKYRFQSENIFMMLLFHISEGRNNQILYGNLKQQIIMNKQSDNQFLMKCIGVLIENNLVIRDAYNKGDTKFDNLGEGELLKINTTFQPKENVKPNQIIMIKISPQMHKAMHLTNVEHGKILRERQKIVEAVLVKLLKHSHSTGNNNMTFQQLYKGICEHSHLGTFKFPESTVKQRLEELIHRGYCERDENDRKIYHYIA